MRRIKSAIPILLLCSFICLLCACGGKDVPAPAKTPAVNTPDVNLEEEPAGEAEVAVGFKVGNLAPDFETTLLTGETVKLSDYRGKVVILNFWASWCPPCVSEMPAFTRLCDEYGDRLVVFAVNCGELKADVQAFVDKNGYAFPVGMDENNAIDYPTSSIPYTLVLDEAGCITHVQLGAGDAETMYTQIYKPALAELLGE